MKALQNMNNTERAFAVLSLFPTELKGLARFIRLETEHFREKEQAIRQAWPKQCIATADFWYMLVKSAEDMLDNFGQTVVRNPRIFADQFFYAHNSVFAIHCMVQYATSEDATPLFRTAVELYFGEEEIKTIEFKKREV